MALIALACAAAFALTGCGGSDPSSSAAGTATAASASSTPQSSAPAGTIEALWQRLGGEPVAIVPGTSDYGPGRNRVSFLVVNSKSQLIEAPTARVWISRGLRQKPFAETTATLEPIGVPGGAQADAQNIYVTTVKTPEAGQVLAARPAGRRAGDPGARRPRSSGKRTRAPSVGDRAIPSVNPILKPGVKPSTITTAQPPDRALLKTTVAAALAAKRPFVVSFATPQYCQSRTCGPVVQVVQSVAKQWQGSGVDFIHIEIYKDNDPAKGTNQWVDQWRLPSEPFTFVVDRTA